MALQCRLGLGQGGVLGVQFLRPGQHPVPDGQLQGLIRLAVRVGRLVLNMKPEELDITTLARILAKQPEEKQRLAALHDSLRVIMKRLVDVNERNKELIENSLEMVEFNLNFIQSTRMSPGNNNYNRNATNSYTSDYGTHGFDAKQ